MSATGVVLASGILRGAVVLAGALFALSLLKRRAAALQHVILCAALFAQVVIPLLSVVAPRSISNVVPPQLTSVIAASELRIAEAAKSVDIHRSSAAIAGRNSLSGIQVLEIVWVAGFVAIIVWMIYGRLYIRRLGARLKQTRSGPIFDALNSAADDLKLHRPVTLLNGSSLAPVTWGTVYPVVLMPADAAEWPDDRLRMSMLHEVAHVIRRDSLTHTTARLAAACMWFNPLVWVALRRMRLAAERAADDIVVNCGIEPTQYVDTLVDMLKSAKPSARLVPVSLAMARRSEFETRMLAVLDDRVARSRVATLSVAGVTIGFACIAVLVAAVPAQVPITNASLPMSLAAASDASEWIKAARKSQLDPRRLQFLKQATQSGQMTSSDIDGYLEVVARMTHAIPVSESIVALTRAAKLDEDQRALTLRLAVNINRSVPRDAALDALARPTTR